MARRAAIEQHGEHADRQQSKAERARHPEGRRRRDDGTLDVGGEHVDARRPADEARHLVGRHAHDEQQQQSRQDRRPQQRHGDPDEDLGVASARHQCGLLHTHVEHAQRRPQRQIGKRKIVARQCPGHSRHRVDVDRRLGESEHRFEHCVAPADVGTEDEDPGHRHQQAGNGEGQERERVKERCAGRISALDHPGDQRAHDEGGDCGGDREDQGVPEQAQDVPARVGLDEIVERERTGAEAGVLGEGIIDEGRQRNGHEPDRNHDARDQHQVGQRRQASQPAAYGRKWSTVMPRYRCVSLRRGRGPLVPQLTAP
jgi:hypothetical protein